jgi:hypothetical protein
LVFELNPPSLLPSLACFSRCHGYQTENVVGATLERPCTCFATDAKRAEITFSLSVVLVVEFRQKSWLIVPF